MAKEVIVVIIDIEWPGGTPLDPDVGTFTPQVQAILQSGCDANNFDLSVADPFGPGLNHESETIFEVTKQ